MRDVQVKRITAAIEAYESAKLHGSDEEKNRCLAVLDSIKRNSTRQEIGAGYREYAWKEG